MMDPITETRRQSEARGLQFTDCGNGHVQIRSKCATVNYWPSSKRRTVYVEGGEKAVNCSPSDAVELALHAAPKKRITNPAGLAHLYTGGVPPWDIPGEFEFETSSDLYRWRAKQYEDRATALYATANDIDQDECSPTKTY